jgi:hypothetical protein
MFWGPSLVTRQLYHTIYKSWEKKRMLTQNKRSETTAGDNNCGAGSRRVAVALAMRCRNMVGPVWVVQGRVREACMR